jgi:CDP-diacylglycerol--glycerol-3-phosphate 3-phosphatidyltransferase|tara:strand:- start:104 stop:634 length:531 start_codon:yes stop_codon:yes gene_type:complete
MTSASYITLLRILLIIPIIYLISTSKVYSALFLFILAGLTDYLDGYIARKTGKTSSLGALLDLLADKLLVCIVLIWCVFLSKAILLIIPTIIIISRELIISSIRQFLVEKTGENIIKVTYVAKTKTTIQMIAISFLILSPEMDLWFYKTSIILIWLAALVSVYTLYNYFNSYQNYF